MGPSVIGFMIAVFLSRWGLLSKGLCDTIISLLHVHALHAIECHENYNFPHKKQLNLRLLLITINFVSNQVQFAQDKSNRSISK